MMTGALKAFLRSRLILPAIISSCSPSASAESRAVCALARASSPRPLPVKTWKRQGSVILWLGACTALSRTRSMRSLGTGSCFTRFTLWRVSMARITSKNGSLKVASIDPILAGPAAAGSEKFTYHSHIDTSNIGGNEMAKSKVTVVGAGNVGGTTAQRLAERNYADVVLVDIVEGLPQGKALDILQSGPILGFDSNVTGTNGYEDTADSDVVVITSGSPRKPGMSRDDLLKTNQNIVGSVTEEVVKHSPDAILVVVANPLDAMCHVALETSGFPRERVVGMAGILDTARYRTFIAQELGVSVRDVFALVLGGHGDTMVPLPSMATVGGIAITELLSEDRVEAIIDRTRQGGAEIVGLLQSGSAFYAPSAAAAEMVDAILLDQKRILPCAAYLQGEYGINDLFVGVPVKLGASGVEEIIELGLTEEELGDLNDSANSVRDLVQVLQG